jgi:hypothetical protein
MVLGRESWKASQGPSGAAELKAVRAQIYLVNLFMKKIFVFQIAIAILLSSCISSGEQETKELLGTELANEVGLQFASPTISSTSTYVTTETYQVIQTPSAEMNVYYDHEFQIKVSYPKGWEEIEERKFIGEDGYLIIAKLPNYDSKNIPHVAIDFANTYYSIYDPRIYCIGFGKIHGCAIEMRGPDPSGKETNKVIGVIPYRKTNDTADYFTIETTRQHYIQIGESIILDENAFEPTPTDEPTTIAKPIEIILQNGIFIREMAISDFNETDEYVDAQEIGTYSNCGIEDNNQNQDFSMSINDGRITVKQRDEIIYEYASWVFNEPNPWSFCTWKDDWIIETHEIIVINGQVLNHKLGYDGIFGWHVLDDKPLFFVQEDNHYLIYYNGTLLPIEYDEISHYQCCGMHIINPRTNGVATWFNGKRDGVWYVTNIRINAP